MENTNKKRIRIGIDARFYGPLGKGLGRYVQEVLDNIIAIDEDEDFEFVVFLSKENYDEFDLRNYKHRKVKKVYTNISWYGFKEQIIFPFILWKEKLDLVHFPHFNVPIFYFKDFILTIHDLILTKFPSKRASTLTSFKYYFKHLMYRFVIKTALKRAKKVITVSNFTKHDIVKRLKIKADKIKVIYEGVSNLNKESDSLFVAKLTNSETLLNYNISGKFLLYVGNSYPHKNLDFLIKCFANLRKNEKELRLVLVGREDYFYRRIKSYASSLNLWHKDNKNSPVVFTDYVPDTKLKILYQEAFLYVFPSLYEGFGLPPLEAMANSCPVLSSDQASLPEILGEAAIYFNPKDENDFIDKYNKLNDEKLRQLQIEKGKARVKLYNWWDCAFKTLEVYKSIVIK